MQVPVEWLRSFLGGDVPDDTALSETLTLIGFEIEGVEGEGDAAVFDVNVTPNRPDALSILGLARELTAAGAGSLRLPEPPTFSPLDRDPEVAIVIDDPELCPRYTARVLRGARLGESPSWLKRRLERGGIRPLNNVVDVTNYVLLERGHPLHAFDLNTLADRTIRVARAGDVESFKTLDGVERSLDPDMLLIWDGKRPVAVAGVMGGLNTEVTDGTTDILLESAYFNPVSVRRTSRRLGLKTEASYRFERGTDIEGLVEALDEATALLVELAGAQVVGQRLDAYPEPFVPPVIKVRPDRINALLGLSVPSERMIGILRDLGFTVEPAGDGGVLDVTLPPRRRDVEGEADLAEEVGRIYGYDKIPETPQGGALGEPSHRDRERAIRARARQDLLGRGLSEAVNYSFMNPGDLDRLRVPGGDRRWSYVVIQNPIRVEDVAMRTTLVPGLLHTLARNLHHGADGIALFEIGRSYFKKNGNGALPEERQQIAIVYRQAEARTIYPPPGEGFFIVKGIVEALFEDLHISGLSFHTAADEAGYHSGKTASIHVHGERLGVVGAVHPDVLERWNLQGDVILAEIDLDALIGQVPHQIRFEPIPRYPAVERDVAFVISRDVPARDVTAYFADAESRLVESVHLFDVYDGKGVPEGKRSLAYRIRYRHGERTLTAEEVEAAHADLIRGLGSRFDIELRA